MSLSINPYQHCTYENQDGDDDYSFSHTAKYCGKPQPRRCGCAFCYPDSDEVEELLRQALNGASDVFSADDFADAIASVKGTMRDNAAAFKEFLDE